MQTKEHWEEVYSHKLAEEVSWFQAYPQRAVNTIQRFNLPRSAYVIDVGGGDSRLVDALLDLGFEQITVLDISETAIQRAKKRLGKKAALVKWVVEDITRFKPAVAFDIWHDRAAFHFLTLPAQVQAYLSVAEASVRSGGFVSVGTFSERGPNRCSNLAVNQYSERDLSRLFEAAFDTLGCEQEDHHTPSGTPQHFTFCHFQKKNAF